MFCVVHTEIYHLLSPSGSLRYTGATKCNQQAANSAHARSDSAHQHCLPVLFHLTPVCYTHPLGLSQYVLHRHLLSQSRCGSHQRRSLQPFWQHQDCWGLLSCSWAEGMPFVFVAVAYIKFSGRGFKWKKNITIFDLAAETYETMCNLCTSALGFFCFF